MSGEGTLPNHESEQKPSTTHPPHTPAQKAQEKGRDKEGSDSEADGAEEILEESPCKRWSKRREKVKQRDVPGIDAAYLAMDNETGNEVVWNEVQFSERKNFREQEEKLKSVFSKLIQLVHVNLVKFHKYWTDSKSEKPRIIFITEYMSSGSMSRFLQRARSSGTLLSIKAWKKWVVQILSALNYLHSCDPPIVHGNLTCNTIFIQQNGLIKIGSVAPNAIHHHVKTFRENLKHMHYIAPEYEHLTEATTQTDIYSFGVCALEMATTGALQWGCPNGEVTSAPTHHPVVTAEAIRKAVDSLEDPLQKDFIEKCLNPLPEKRPAAHELLFHSVLFEVHSLKLLAGHAIVSSTLMEQLSEDDFRVRDKTKVVATSKWKQFSYADLPSFQVDLDKFLEDVRNGIYPLTAFAPMVKLLNASPSMSAINTITAAELLVTRQRVPSIHQHHHMGATSGDFHANGDGGLQMKTGGEGRAQMSLQNGPVGSILGSTAQPSTGIINNGFLPAVHPGGGEKDEGYHTAQSTGGALANATGNGENRLVVQMQARVLDDSSLQLLLQLDDQMNRQLTTELSEGEDSAEGLVAELVQHGFISNVDSARMCSMLRKTLEEWLENRRKSEAASRPTNSSPSLTTQSSNTGGDGAS